MTNLEYARHLSGAAGLDDDLQCPEYELADRFYGLFQCFMPDGDGVRAVFAPLQNGDELLARIMPVYEATSERTKEAFEHGSAPGYFCPPQAKFDESTLKSLALAYVQNLKIFAQFIANEELLRQLSEVKSARVQESFNFRDREDELGGAVYDAISDWRIDAPKLDARLEVLSEAYYSVNCDYILSAYLQYPNYARRPSVDFLKPYFELYLAGRGVAFERGEIVIFTH